jgi:hypothetical protein
MSNALKITHFLIPLLFFSSLSFGQTENYRQDPEWIKHYQSKGFISSSLSVDDKGNYYSAGSFEQYLGLSPTEGIVPSRSRSTEKAPNHLFAQKHDPSGNLLWTIYANGEGRVHDISLADDGHLYIVGEVFSAGLVMSSADGHLDTLQKPNTDLSRGIYILKYSAEGNLIKSLFWSEDQSENANSVLVDPEGNVYIGGSFSYRIENELIRSYLLLKFSSDFELIWKKKGSQKGRSSLVDLCFDRRKNLIIAGNFTEQLIIDSEHIELNHKSQKPFIAKLKPNGNLDWISMHLDSSPELDYGNTIISICADRWSRIYATGHSNGRFQLLRLTRNGGVKWRVSQIVGYGTYPQAIIRDPNTKDLFISGNGYAAGFPTTRGDTLNFSTVGSTDFFVLRYNQKGKILGLITGGGIGTDYAQDIALKEDKIIILGHDLGGPKIKFKDLSIGGSKPVVWIAQFKWP